MDCDSCGRYRPSSEILAERRLDGLLQMACLRCRQFVAERRALTRKLPVPAPSTAAGYVRLAALG
jgi:hypothetical protein